jgi:hypothetical protein
MSARYDVETTEPNAGQLSEPVELIRVNTVDSIEVRALSGLRSTGWVA